MLFLAVKIVATVFLASFLLAGLMRASPRFHSSSYPSLAEYTAGFISTALACTGFYYLWIS